LLASVLDLVQAGTVSVGREGGGTSVIEVSSGAGSGVTASKPTGAYGIAETRWADCALGGGGRTLVVVEGAGGCGRILGGGGRDRPRTGGGGGVPEGRDTGGMVVPDGRGGSETGRGGSATGRNGGGGADAETSLGAAAMFSLSLALP